MQEEECCDLKLQINGKQTLFLNQKILCTFSGRLRKLVKQQKKRSHGCLSLQLNDFPANPESFELVSRFCYNDGKIFVSPSNVTGLYISAAFLDMTEEFSPCNLLSQTESFLERMNHWMWDNIIVSLKSCESFLSSAETYGVLENLLFCLLTKISSNLEVPLNSPSSISSSSSAKTQDKEWWYEDLTLLPPRIIERMVMLAGAYMEQNNNLTITRFLLYYLKTMLQKGSRIDKSEYGRLADTAVHGVVLMGRSVFSCRGLFWVLRVVSGLGLSKECRHKLEKVMGLMVDKVSLDDLLVCGHEDGGVYDVSLVMRLVRVFVGVGVSLERMKKVGKLMDKYLREVAPDQGLKVSKFLGLAESLPDSARDCFDGVYRALDIYLESHPNLTIEEKSRLCRCLNYEKLTFEASKDLAKNPRIPPRAAVQALVSQQAKLQPQPKITTEDEISLPSPLSKATREEMYHYHHKEAWENDGGTPSPLGFSDDKEELRMKLQKMQWRVVELEKVCREMKGQMSKMVRNKSLSSGSSHQISKGLPRLC